MDERALHRDAGPRWISTVMAAMMWGFWFADHDQHMAWVELTLALLMTANAAGWWWLRAVSASQAQENQHGE